MERMDLMNLIGVCVYILTGNPVKLLNNAD